MNTIKYSSGLNNLTDLNPADGIIYKNMEAKRMPDYENIYILVEKIKQGDRDAFMEITQLYQKKVYQLAYAFFRNHDDALDIVQETFLRFYQKVDMYQRGKNFQNWILQIAKNLCIDFYRKHHKKNNEHILNKPIDEMNLPEKGSHNRNTSSDLKDIFAQCLKKLTEKQRMIFVMKHHNQLKYTEIAQILGIAVGTVKSLNFKAIQNLRVLMNPYLGGNNETQ